MRIRLSVKSQQPAQTPDAIIVTRPRVTIPHRAMRVLDFDIENRPLSYLGSDFTTAEVTAIAWAWTDAPQDVSVYLLGETPLPDILRRFVEAYTAADMVTGHFILGHDLPMIQGALMECGLPPLGDKLVQDTKVHLLSAKGISRSQESLGAMLELDAPKVSMNQSKWRAANRLTPEGLREVRERVVGDVRQHIELRRVLLERGLLGPPKVWRSGAAAIAPYTP